MEHAGRPACVSDRAHAILEFVAWLGMSAGGWGLGDHIPDSKVGQAHVVKGVSRRVCRCNQYC